MSRAESAAESKRWDFLAGMAAAPLVFTFIGLPVLLVTALSPFLPETAIWLLAALVVLLLSSFTGALVARSYSKRFALGVAAAPLALAALGVYLVLQEISSSLPFVWWVVFGPAFLAGYLFASKRRRSEPLPDASA